MKTYPDDIKVRLCGAAGGMVGGVIGLFVVKPYVELPLGLGAIAFVALIGIGVLVGQTVGLRMFPPSSGGPPPG